MQGEKIFAFRVDADTIYAFEADQTTVWELPQYDKQDVGGHATPKPVECMARPIRNHGGQDDDVFDPFLGSGTTLVAPEKCGRRCFGIELQPKFCDVIIERWKAITGGSPILAEGS